MVGLKFQPFTRKKSISENKLIASICRSSFFEFEKEFWDIIIPDKPVWNWHIEKIAHEIQVASERVIRNEPKLYDLLINIPPGTTKSTSCSVMKQAWVWTKMPSAKFICASFAFSLAMDLARKHRDLVESPKYRAVFPDIQIRSDQNTKQYFMNTKLGMRYSVGSGGAIIGMHAHFLDIDDPIDPRAAYSVAETQAVNIWIDEYLSRRKTDQSVALTTLVQQRLGTEDPTWNMLAKGTPVRHICLPAEMTYPVLPEEWKSYYSEGLLDPVRLPRTVLKDALRQLGPYGYAGQYGEQPVPRGGGIFQTEKFRIEKFPPKKMKKIVRFWDKACTSKGGDYTVGVKMGFDFQDTVWILDVVREQWDSNTREMQMDKEAMMDGKGVKIGIEQEPGSGGKESAEKSARRLAKMGFKVTLVPAHGDPEGRADAYSTEVNASNVVLVEAPWNKPYITEHTHFPMSSYTDQVMASAGAYTLLSKMKTRVGLL